MSCSLFPSISFNLRKSQMKSMTFFRRPRGPKMSQISKCPDVRVVLTYREALGEVSELNIKVYFISVPMDHTVSTAGRQGSYFDSRSQSL